MAVTATREVAARNGRASWSTTSLGAGSTRAPVVVTHGQRAPSDRDGISPSLNCSAHARQKSLPQHVGPIAMPDLGERFRWRVRLVLEPRLAQAAVAASAPAVLLSVRRENRSQQRLRLFGINVEGRFKTVVP